VSARRSGSGAVVATTLPAVRGAWRSSRNGLLENANERRGDFVQRSNCPTQAKTGLEWATRLSKGAKGGAPCRALLGWADEDVRPYVVRSEFRAGGLPAAR
jgi:hypothetical protein